ncbi:alpha/beta fold hydrolase [Alginatibacterium sediminis]|uniref:Alpha/beta fold hydrolase n=1 Tax=Alginatibacterium sediminis TaxID=2164068 RepID=A0A420EAY0_9ALTE|nr:alpha/beta fold hydrolase [Alginatibacterium sediminis]RKF17849.1 alpha/beta fold hydrolase [Alginatibacterium sediminis]
MNLNYSDQGQGPVVILIHGLFGAKSNLQLCARHLVDQGYRVVSVDARNHGQSPREDGMNYKIQANDIISLAQDLELSSFSLLGHSMGGKVAMATALLAPDKVDQLIVADIAPVVYQASHAEVFQGLKAVELAKIENRKQAEQQLAQFVTMPEVRQFLLRSLSKQDQGWNWDFDINALQTYYSEILDWPNFDNIYSGPCLFIKGSDSEYIKAEFQTKIMQQFPNATLKIIQDAGHWLHAQKPSLFNRISAHFLSKSQ